MGIGRKNSMILQERNIFESAIMIVSEHQTLANILKEQCMLYGFNNISVTPDWKSFLHELSRDIPDIIVSDQLPEFDDQQLCTILQSWVTFRDALPVIFYSLPYDSSQVTIPDGLKVVAALYGRDQQQRLLEVIHEELDKSLLERHRLTEEQRDPQHLNILLITADHAFSQEIRHGLEQSDCYVGVIATGEDAIAHIHGILPHIIFLDYTLPGMSGLALFYWLRMVYPEITTIMLLGEYEAPELLAELENAGASYHLKKPIDASHVSALCQGITEKRKQYDSIFGKDEYSEVLEENAKILAEFTQLKESEENLRTLVNTSGDIVFRISPQGIVNFTSPAVQEQLGYILADLEKERINIAKFVHPEDLIRVMAAIRQVIRGESIQGLECRLMHQDKVYFQWYSINCYPMYNPHKQFVGVGGIARDIASIKDFEEKTWKQNKRLTALNTIARIVTQSLNLDDILHNVLDNILDILKLQAGSIFLTDPVTKELTLKNYRTFFSGANGEECTLLKNPDVWQKLHHNVFETTAPLIVEDLAVHPLFSETKLIDMGFRSLVSIPLKSKDVILGALALLTKEPREFDDDDLQLLISIGNQVGMTIENITLYQQELRARERLEELNKLKDDFLAIASHDLRSPLTAILGASELLLHESFMETPLTSEQQELVETIFLMGKQQLHYVNDLLDLAKIESGKLELNLTRTHLQFVGQQCYQNLKVLADQKNIEVNFIAEPDLPKISIDVPKVGQVLNNLLGNAIKFTRSGGKVTISIEQENDDFLRISVTDTGEGIKPEYLKILFDKFQQVKSVGTGGERGTGLGLSICKNLVELHKGKIWVESRVGFGSTFSFTLPITEDVILIIDDSSFVVESLEKMLLQHIEHVKVVQALSGQAGLEQVAERFPSVIILDYMMPDMNGIEVFQELLNRYGPKVPPTIFLTASRDLDVRRRIFELGADDYLRKPVDNNDLLPRISRFL